MSKIKQILFTAWKKTENARIVMRKELRSYFISPIAYIVITLFLAISGILFFSSFFINNQAEMRGFFQILPILFSIFIPALTMRLFAEERNTGSFETLVTMPLSIGDIVAGKILGATVFITLMLAPTLIYAISIIFTGSMDAGPVIGGYLGSILLGATFSAIGVFTSSLTRNQVVSFIAALSICLGLTLIDKFLMFFPSRVVNAIEYIGADFHFRSVAKGVIDSRDIIYFASVIALAVLGTVRAIEVRR
ncbi:MAG TPA: ABC transporter permease subunit [Spirochaetota bacterium]